VGHIMAAHSALCNGYPDCLTFEDGIYKRAETAVINYYDA
jgi:hypothetical protein